MAATFGQLQTIIDMMTKVLKNVSKIERNIQKMVNKSINGCKSDVTTYQDFGNREEFYNPYFIRDEQTEHRKSLDSNSGQQVSEVLYDSNLVKLIENKSTQFSTISKDIKSNSDDMVSI